METTVEQNFKGVRNNIKVWIGRIVSGICILFLLTDAIMKIIKEIHAVEGSVKLGLATHSIQGIGFVLLICTLLYAFPRTAILGAVLLTGYLGGAIAIMVRAGEPLYFALGVGLLVWLGLYLRDNRLSAFNPLIK